MTVEPLLRDEPAFIEWVNEMEEGIGKLNTIVGSCVANQLVGDIPSLDILETWLLSTFSDDSQLLLADNAKVYDGTARYFGEVLRQAVHGNWAIDLKNKRSFDYGYPFIDRAPLCTPHFCITAAIDRKRGNYLSSIVKKAQSNTH